MAEKAVTVIRHPVNNAFPDTELTPSEAKRQLGLRDDEKAILFFGRIRPYKGIEHLLAAFQLLVARSSELPANHCRRAKKRLRRISATRSSKPVREQNSQQARSS